MFRELGRISTQSNSLSYEIITKFFQALSHLSVSAIGGKPETLLGFSQIISCILDLGHTCQPELD